MIVIDVVLHEGAVVPGEDFSKLPLCVMLEQHAADKQVVHLAARALPQASVMSDKVLQPRDLGRPVDLVEHDLGEEGAETHRLVQDCLDPRQESQGERLVSHDVSQHDQHLEIFVFAHFIAVFL